MHKNIFYNIILMNKIPCVMCPLFTPVSMCVLGLIEKKTNKSNHSCFKITFIKKKLKLPEPKLLKYIYLVL